MTIWRASHLNSPFTLHLCCQWQIIPCSHCSQSRNGIPSLCAASVWLPLRCSLSSPFSSFSSSPLFSIYRLHLHRACPVQFPDPLQWWSDRYSMETDWAGGWGGLMLMPAARDRGGWYVSGAHKDQKLQHNALENIEKWHTSDKWLNVSQKNLEMQCNITQLGDYLINIYTIY